MIKRTWLGKLWCWFRNGKEHDWYPMSFREGKYYKRECSVCGYKMIVSEFKKGK